MPQPALPTYEEIATELLTTQADIGVIAQRLRDLQSRCVGGPLVPANVMLKDVAQSLEGTAARAGMIAAKFQPAEVP